MAETPGQTKTTTFIFIPQQDNVITTVVLSSESTIYIFYIMKPNDYKRTNNVNKTEDDFITNIKSDINAIAAATITIGEINDKSMRSIKEAEEKKLSNKLQRLVDVTDFRIKQTEETINNNNNNNTMKEGIMEGGKKATPPTTTTTMMNEFVELQRRFDEETMKYQQARQNYHTGMKIKVERQIRMVKPDISDEEIENIMKRNGNGREELIRQMILMGGVQKKNKNKTSSTIIADEKKEEEDNNIESSSVSSETPMYSCTDFDWCSSFLCG